MPQYSPPYVWVCSNGGAQAAQISIVAGINIHPVVVECFQVCTVLPFHVNTYTHAVLKQEQGLYCRLLLLSKVILTAHSFTCNIYQVLIYVSAAVKYSYVGFCMSNPMFSKVRELIDFQMYHVTPHSPPPPPPSSLYSGTCAGLHYVLQFFLYFNKGSGPFVCLVSSVCSPEF